MQQPTNEATARPTRVHAISDIRAVIEITKLAEVNRSGVVISSPSVISEEVKQTEWVCQPCEIRFHQWTEVLAHMQQCRVAVTDSETGWPLQAFAQTYLGVTLTPVQIRIAEAVLKGQRVLDWRASGRNLLSEEARKRLKNEKMNGHHGTLIIVDDYQDGEGEDNENR